MQNKPTADQIRQAAGKTINDVVDYDLRILFCGINPGLYSGAVGHNFARPGNRFWPALFRSGLTDRLLAPWEERQLLQYELGVTNFVERATAGASELTNAELRAGAAALARKIKRFRPKIVAVLGVGAFRIAFEKKQVRLGRQPEKLESATVWVLPNPSGLNAHYQLPELTQQFRLLRAAI